MSVFKSLVERAQAKKDELAKQARRKAAEKAAEAAIERGKEMAKDAVAQAGKALSSAGATIEDALFGPDSEAAEAKDAKVEKDEKEANAIAARDRLAAERRRRDAADRRADEARIQREVDDELAAMKRRLGK